MAQEMNPPPARPGGRPHARLRRAARAGFQGVDRPEAPAPWWGPKGFTTPSASWTSGRAAPLDRHARTRRRRHPMRRRLCEVVEPERLVFTCVAVQTGDGKALLEAYDPTVTFAEQGGMTKLTVHAQAPSALIAGRYRRSNARRHGGGLDAEPRAPRGAGADRRPGDCRGARLRRAAGAGVSGVDRCRSTSAKWWGPKGFTNTFHEDGRAAGRRLAVRHARPRRHRITKTRAFLSRSRGRSGSSCDHVSWPQFRLTATFEDRGRQDAADLAHALHVGGRPRQGQGRRRRREPSRTWSRLAAELATMAVDGLPNARRRAAICIWRAGSVSDQEDGCNR